MSGVGRVFGLMFLAASAVACGPIAGDPAEDLAAAGGAGSVVEVVDSPLLASGCAQKPANVSAPLNVTTAPPGGYSERYLSGVGFQTNRSGCGTYFSLRATNNHYLWGGLRVYVGALDTDVARYCPSANSWDLLADYEIWSLTHYAGWKRLKYKDRAPFCNGVYVNWTWRDTCVEDGDSCIAWDVGKEYVVTAKLYRGSTGAPLSDVRAVLSVQTTFGFQ